MSEDNDHWRALVEQLQEDNTKLEKEKTKLEKEKAEDKAKLAKLQTQLAGRAVVPDRAPPLGFVTSISAAAKSADARDIFYREVLRKEEVPGGFVGERMYIEFVLEARKNHEDEIKPSAKAWALAFNEGDRNHTQMLSKHFRDDEKQQSAILAAIMACYAKDDMLVVHQQHVKEKLKDGDCIRAVDNKYKMKKGGVADFEVDVGVSYLCNKTFWPLAAVEYKPDQRDEDARCAQRDMYATTIVSLTQQPCIGIDVAGGKKVDDWKISAWGYLENPRIDKPSFEMSKLYEGTGLHGIADVMCGLQACHTYAKENPTKTPPRLGQRLGPVVGRQEESVYKAYDGAQYRQHNIDVIKEMLDSEAELLEMEECKIVKMRYFESNWNENITVEKFWLLAKELAKLHEKDWIHGDIRLANLLSCGKIIDFDFVNQKHYPAHLNIGIQDGERHPLISKLSKEELGSTEIDIAHDWYSFGAVMSLFNGTRNNQTQWIEICNHFKKGNHKEGTAALSGCKDWEVELEPGYRKILFETGPTPKKSKPQALLDSVDETT